MARKQKPWKPLARREVLEIRDHPYWKFSESQLHSIACEVLALRAKVKRLEAEVDELRFYELQYYTQGH